MRFLKLATNWEAYDGQKPYTYPYWVDVSVNGERPMVAFSQGVGHASGGGYFTVEEAVLGMWSAHLDKAGGSWLRPYLERLAAGERVGEDELIAAYTQRHRQEPDSYEASPALPR